MQGYWSIIINGIEFKHSNNSLDQWYYWVGDIRGFGIGDIRTATGVNSGADGGYVDDQFLGLREIPLKLFVYSMDYATTEELMLEMNQIFPVNEAFDVRLITPTGAQYLIKDCYVAQADPKLADVRNLIDYEVTLVTGDTNIYAFTNGTGTNTLQLTKTMLGGIPWGVNGIEWTEEGIVWNVGEDSPVATNSGNSITYPVITIAGAVTNPVFTNLESGRVLSLNITTNSGDTIVLDFLNRTAVLNGTTNIYPNIVLDDFWPLVVGDNEISYTSGSGDDSAVVTMTWKNSYRGIM